MSHSWAYLGDADLPCTALGAWLDSPADPALSVAALEARALREFGLDGAATTPTIRQLLGELQRDQVASVSLAGPITFRCLADKGGDAWLTWRANIVAAFVALGAHDGRGRLDVVGFDDGPDEGFRVEVDRDGARIVLLEAADVERVRERGDYRELIAVADAHYRALSAAARAEAPQPRPAAAPGSYEHQAMRTIAERVFHDARDGLKRIERRILWAMHEGGAASEGHSVEDIAARVHERWPRVACDLAVAAFGAFAARRGASLALVDEVAGRHRLAPMAAEMLAAVDPKDLTVVEPGASPEPPVLPMPVPWLLVAGGHAVGVGMECHVEPVAADVLLAAARDRLASPPRTPRGLDGIPDAHVLVDGDVRTFTAVALVDAFLAHRRQVLAARGVTEIGRTIEAELNRWLATGA